jgi:hypothetical protein
VCGDLVLQSLVEAHALPPLKGMSHVGVVGGHEGFDLLGGDAGIRKVRAAQALATEDRKPDLDEAQPASINRTP